MLQVTKAAKSKLQPNAPPGLVDVNVNVASVLLVTAIGPDVIVVSGGVVSTPPT